jgi:hypothetical protein
MPGTSTTSPPRVAESQRFLIGLCNAIALGTLFWTACWWLLA